MPNAQTVRECLEVLEDAPIVLSSARIASSHSFSLQQAFCFLQSVGLLECPATVVYDGVCPLLLQLFNSDGSLCLSFDISYQ